MRLKFWELKMEDGVFYKDNNGNIWTYSEITEGFYCGLKGGIVVYYTNKQLIEEITFEEVTDWSKVSIDTKILVWDRESKQKKRRHLAGVHEVTGRIMAWRDGQTSFTTTDKTAWDCAELYKEEEGEE